MPLFRSLLSLGPSTSPALPCQGSALMSLSLLTKASRKRWKTTASPEPRSRQAFGLFTCVQRPVPSCNSLIQLSKIVDADAISSCIRRQARRKRANGHPIACLGFSGPFGSPVAASSSPSSSLLRLPACMQIVISGCRLLIRCRLQGAGRHRHIRK